MFIHTITSTLNTSLTIRRKRIFELCRSRRRFSYERCDKRNTWIQAG